MITIKDIVQSNYNGVVASNINSRHNNVYVQVPILGVI